MVLKSEEIYIKINEVLINEIKNKSNQFTILLFFMKKVNNFNSINNQHK